MEDEGSIPVSRPSLDTSSQIESVKKVASTFNEEEQRKSIENNSVVRDEEFYFPTNQCYIRLSTYSYLPLFGPSFCF